MLVTEIGILYAVLSMMQSLYILLLDLCRMLCLNYKVYRAMYAVSVVTALCTM